LANPSMLYFYCPHDVDAVNFLSAKYPYTFGSVTLVNHTTTRLLPPNNPKCDEVIFTFDVTPYNTQSGPDQQQNDVTYYFNNSVTPQRKYSPSWTYVVMHNTEIPGPSSFPVFNAAGGGVAPDLQTSWTTAVTVNDSFKLESISANATAQPAAKLTLLRSTIVTNSLTGEVAFYDGVIVTPSVFCSILVASPISVLFLFPANCRANWTEGLLYTYVINATDGVYYYPSMYLTLTVLEPPAVADSSSSLNLALVIGASIGGLVVLVCLIAVIRWRFADSSDENTRLLDETDTAQ